jgi:hypothetical protein
MSARRRSTLRRASSLLPVVALAAACRSSRPLPEEPPASREDVTEALYEQLDLVLARHDALEGVEEPAAREEQQELARLADEIALRIVRIDPAADVDALKAKLERTR